jgi:hypothetical protein
MDNRILEVVTAVATLALYIALIVLLPMAMPGSQGFAYLIALVVFIVTLSVAGYQLDKRAA